MPLTLRLFGKHAPIQKQPDGFALKFLKESSVMSDHHLKFKGPGFNFDAKGWIGIGAAIVIILLVLLMPRLLY